MKFGPRAAALAHRCTANYRSLCIAIENERVIRDRTQLLYLKIKTGPREARAHKRSLSRALIPTGLLTRCPHVVLI